MCFGGIVYLLLSGLFQKQIQDCLDTGSCVNNQHVSLGMDMNWISDPSEDLA